MYVLTNQGATGLVYLVDLANRGIIGLSERILDYLARSEWVIMGVILPVLMQDVMDISLGRHRDVALAVLNRLAPLMGKHYKEIANQTFVHNDYLTQLTTFLHDAAIDKSLLMATIRCSGVEGERLLLDILRSKQLSEHAALLGLSMLSWRVPSSHVLRIKVIDYTLENCFLPRLYQYEGMLEPWKFGAPKE